MRDSERRQRGRLGLKLQVREYGTTLGSVRTVRVRRRECLRLCGSQRRQRGSLGLNYRCVNNHTFTGCLYFVRAIH